MDRSNDRGVDGVFSRDVHAASLACKQRRKLCRWFAIPLGEAATGQLGRCVCLLGPSRFDQWDTTHVRSNLLLPRCATIRTTSSSASKEPIVAANSNLSRKEDMRSM